MNDHTIAAPVCKFEEGCHRVVPCEPGCGAASPSVGPSALCVAEALEHGPVRCPLCPDGLVLHTPDGARAHFTHVHPEQPLVGPGPWPMLGELPVDRAALRDRIAEAALRAVEIAMEDTLLPAAREEALAGIAAVLPAPADRAAVLAEAADAVAKEREATDVNVAVYPRYDSRQKSALHAAESLLRRLAGEAAPDNTEAHPSRHRWYVETYDYLADEWAPGMRLTDRAQAVERHKALSEQRPAWNDGTPVKRRLVRETTSYTVESTKEPSGSP